VQALFAAELEAKMGEIEWLSVCDEMPPLQAPLALSQLIVNQLITN